MPTSSPPLSYRTQARSVPPPLVALAAWLLPGAGYFLVGQRARGLVIGTTILFVFASGLLIGGIRSVEAPPLERGRRIPISLRGLMQQPWFAAQVLTGPVGLAGAAAGNWASKPANPNGFGPPRAAVSHGRVNEIAVLYTAVAGLLNLLAMIDSAHRAGDADPTGPASPGNGDSSSRTDAP